MNTLRFLGSAACMGAALAMAVPAVLAMRGARSMAERARRLGWGLE